MAFVVLLRLASPPVSTMAQLPAASFGEKGIPMSAIRILMAEDNDLVALTLEEQLKGLGYDVIGVARTGAEAIDLAGRT
jgi:hypothetical protein